MSAFFDKIKIIQQIIADLTWRKIAQFSVFLLLISLTWASFENRQSIYNFMSRDKNSRLNPAKVTISHITQTEIKDVVSRSELIIGVQITLVDFQKNTRHIVFSEFDSPILSNIYSRFVNNTFGELPLFNNDTLNNGRIIDLINGEFNCIPYPKSINSKFLPESTKYVDTTCAAGIPPFYGKFTGKVTLHLNRQPSSVEIDQLRTLTNNLSSKIYDNDLR